MITALLRDWTYQARGETCPTGGDVAADADASCRGIGRAQCANIRVDGDVQQGESVVDHERRKQEEGIANHSRRRYKEQQACFHRAERCDDAWLVTDPRDDPAAWYRHDELRAEEAELYQQCFQIAQMKELLEVRNQDIVRRGDEADAEGEADQQHNRQREFAACGIRWLVRSGIVRSV